MVGLGRMGANLVRRLMRDGHECVAFDLNEVAVKQLESEGAVGARTLEEFVGKLSTPRAAWVMVPAAYAGQTVEDLAAVMDSGDIIIDGGNSYYRDDVDRAKTVLDSVKDKRALHDELVSEHCPKCHGSNVEAVGFSVPFKVLSMLFLGLPLLLAYRFKRCNDCGHRWRVW